MVLLRLPVSRFWLHRLHVPHKPCALGCGSASHRLSPSGQARLCSLQCQPTVSECTGAQLVEMIRILGSFGASDIAAMGSSAPVRIGALGAASIPALAAPVGSPLGLAVR